MCCVFEVTPLSLGLGFSTFAKFILEDLTMLVSGSLGNRVLPANCNAGSLCRDASDNLASAGLHQREIFQGHTPSCIHMAATVSHSPTLFFILQCIRCLAEPPISSYLL